MDDDKLQELADFLGVCIDKMREVNHEVELNEILRNNDIDNEITT